MPAIVRPVGDERDALLTFLEHERHVLLIAAHGLTDAQARLAPTVSDLSIGFLLTHMTSTERTWASMILGVPRPPDDEEPATLAAVIDAYRDAMAGTDAVIASVDDLDRAVPLPVGTRWAPPDTVWSVRWVLLHLIHETARHAGHADIIRESIDGATALPLMAAVEDWPARRTITPWTATPTPTRGEQHERTTPR
jgi:uncharacterized damage-inducible protein DinB